MHKSLWLFVAALLLPSCQRSDRSQDQKLANVDSLSYPAYAPIPVVKPQPVWPDILKRANIPGDVDLAILVDESGRVIDAQVTKSLNALVDSASIHAAWNWRFTPGRIPDTHGSYRASKFWVPVSFSWTL